ncbi:MAG: type II toxin-antitoxin system PemK/MazF family toxin [Candidatus Melainabacteria bacterium]|nr:type II toxin-antitoxin system PemK/MazF family toxin [Candidatus Melainabacteria bacterium]
MAVHRSISRGDIWIVDFEPGVTGHEQGGQPRPSVILSSSAMDPDDTGLVIVVPSTTTRRPKTGELVPNHHQVEPTKQNGLTSTSYFMCEQVRCVSVGRLGEHKIGRLSPKDMYEIEERLIILMDLGA